MQQRLRRRLVGPERIGALQKPGKTVSVLLADNKPIGVIAMRDEPRPDALASLSELARRGMHHHADW